MWHGANNVGIWVDPFELDRVNAVWEVIDAGRTGRFGARAVRTAPSREDLTSPLWVDRLPKLFGYDVAFFYLTGHFKNTGNRTLKVELVTPFPDTCFPDGAASRVFTAPPLAVTPFRIAMMLTSRNAADAVCEKGGMLNLRIQDPEGKVQVERTVRMLINDPRDVTSPVIGSLDGGNLTLRLTNTTDRSFSMGLMMLPSVDVKLSEHERSIELNPGAGAQAVFHIPRQGFARQEVRMLPYRLTVTGAGALDGEVAAALRMQSDWWVSCHTNARPEIAEGSVYAGDLNGGPTARFDVTSITESPLPLGVPNGLFRMTTPPNGWFPVIGGTNVPLHAAGELPTHGSSALAATRFESPDDASVSLNVKYPGPLEGSKKLPFVLQIWLNEQPVFQSPSDTQDYEQLSRLNPRALVTSKTVRLRSGINTLMVSCKSNLDSPVVPRRVFIRILDAQTSALRHDLILDMSH